MCVCLSRTAHPREFYIHKLSILLWDIETDNARNIMQIALYDLVTHTWFNEEGLWDTTEKRSTHVWVPENLKVAHFVDYANHGITYRITDKSPTWPSVWQAILTWISHLQVEKTLWIAHNGNSFDYPVFKKHCLRHNLLGDTQKFPVQWYFGDSVVLVRYILGEKCVYSLDGLVKLYSLTMERQHHAWDDTNALRQILESMVAQKTDDILAYLVEFFVDHKTN